MRSRIGMNHLFGSPFTFAGLNVYEDRPAPKLRIRDDFEWCSDTFRAEMNVWLLDQFGLRESIVPRDSVLISEIGGFMVMRPEHSFLLANITA